MTIRYNDFFTANYDVNRKGQSIIFIDLSHNRIIRKRTNNNLRGKTNELTIIYIYSKTKLYNDKG